MQTVGGRAPLHGELGQYYDAIENPRRERGELPILHDAELRAYMARGARADAGGARRGRHRPRRRGPAAARRLRLRDARRPRAAAPGDDAAAAADARRAVPAGRGRPRPRSRPRRIEGDGGTVRVEAGTYEIGAPDRGFAYDNERPRHAVELAAFEIDRTPVTNGAYIEYMGETGAEPPMYWERDGDGWARTAMGVSVAGRPGASRRPRLLGRGRRLRPLGRQAPADRVRVGGGARRGSTASAAPGSGPRPTSVAYPGFAAFPYKEYSEVFFGDDLQGAARRLLGDPPARRPAELPQLGPAAAPPDLRRHPPRLRLRREPLMTIAIDVHLSTDQAAAMEPTCARASPGRRRSSRRSTSTTSAARSCSRRSPSSRSTTRPAASARSWSSARPRSSPPRATRRR